MANVGVNQEPAVTIILVFILCRFTDIYVVICLQEAHVSLFLFLLATSLFYEECLNLLLISYCKVVRIELIKFNSESKVKKKKIRGAYDKFPDFFFVRVFKIAVDTWKLSMFIAMHLMRWLTNFYDIRFKWTPTAVIGIHPTKAWLSQLVNFKNAIWTL